MTILTKPSVAKKPEKGVLVAQNVCLEAGISSPLSLSGSQSLVMIRSRGSGNAATLLLFLIALLVMFMGILGGIIVYRQFASHRNLMKFHGACRIPYDVNVMNNDVMLAANQEFIAEEDNNQQTWINMLMNDLNAFAKEIINESKDFEQITTNKNTTDAGFKFLQEDVELDISDEESYSKIIPKFSSDASFLHDFKAGLTGIIDKAAQRCFVMPLDKETLLAPKTMADLITKMHQGYYDINTEILQKTMRIKFPAVSKTFALSSRIANECKGYEIYELEKVLTGVSKRSIRDPFPSKHYEEFAGLGFNNYFIMNLGDLGEFTVSKQ